MANLYRLEIRYNTARGELKRFEYLNATDRIVHDIRAGILAEGLKIPVSLTEWIIIFPWAIADMIVTRQNGFIDYAHSDLNKTVFAKDPTKLQ